MWELTVRVWFLTTPPSFISMRVAFSVVKKRPRCLYRTKTSFVTPVVKEEMLVKCSAGHVRKKQIKESLGGDAARYITPTWQGSIKQ